MATVDAVLTGGFDESDANSYATASVTLDAGKVYVIEILNLDGNTPGPIDSVVRGAEAASLLANGVYHHDTGGQNAKGWRYIIKPVSGTTGTIVFDFVADTQEGLAWVVYGLTDVVVTGTDGVDAFVQTVNNINNGTSVTLTLAAYSDGDNIAVGAAAVDFDEDLSIDSGWTEISQQNMTNDQDTLHVWKLSGAQDTTAVSSSATASRNHGGCLSEIKDSGVGGRIMGSLAGHGGLAGAGGIAGKRGGLAA